VALGLGLGLCLLSVTAEAEIGPGATLYLAAGALTYAVVYTAWLKRRTPFSIVWGGAAGSFAALAGWQTASSTLAPAPLLLAGVLFLWTPSHFWSFAIARANDYRTAGVPTLVAVAGRAGGRGERCGPRRVVHPPRCVPAVAVPRLRRAGRCLVPRARRAARA
jgi:protoheme IX farnesyltransferase